jgi:phosphatidate cytidylyltransferase
MQAGIASLASSDRHPSRIATRVLTAAIGIPVVLLVNDAGGVAFGAVVAMAAGVGALEMCWMTRRAGYRPLASAALPVAAAVAALPLVLPRPQSAWIGIIAIFLACTAAYYLSPRSYAGGLVNWLLTLAPVLYVGLLLGHVSLLRQLGHGAWWVFCVLVVTRAYDTGAYFAGSFFGRRPFMRHVSPSKTLEGVAGGLLFSTVAGFVFMPGVGLAVWQAPALGLALGVAAQAGDLVESMLKRQTGVKDSGSIVPGHGGLLDRIDSLLFTGVLTYYVAALLGYVS